MKKHHTIRKPMRRNSSSTKKGLPPGSLIHIGHNKTIKTKVECFIYDDKNFDCINDEIDFSKINLMRNNDKTIWVNITGYSNINMIKTFGEVFNIHSLVLEDILNTHQRVKAEIHKDYLFLTLKQISILQEEISYTQFSIIKIDNIIFTFSENTKNLVDNLKERLKDSNSKIRVRRSDYLLYAIIDYTVDQYFQLTDIVDEGSEKIDFELMSNPDNVKLAEIHDMRMKILKARKSVYPLREIMMLLTKNDNNIISQSTHIFYKDIYDHVLRLIDSLDVYREMTAWQLEIYLSSMSNKMNAVMKLLTIFASIFIPLTFLAGIYGMNFEYMPELNWKYSYPAIWIIFITIGISLFIFFHRKKWIK